MYAILEELAKIALFIGGLWLLQQVGNVFQFMGAL